MTPLRAPRLSALPQFQGEHRERTLWGTYRPGLYLGAMDSDKSNSATPGAFPCMHPSKVMYPALQSSAFLILFQDP